MSAINVFLPMATMIGEKLEKVFNSLDSMKNDAIANATITPESIDKEMWDTVLKMGATVIMPFAILLLSIFFCSELYSLYCRSDGKLDLEIVSSTFLKLIFPFVLITSSYGLIEIVFNLFTNTVSQMGTFIENSAITSTINGHSEQVTELIDQSNNIDGWWDRLMFYLELFPLEFLIGLASLGIFVVTYGRLFEIMIHWIFAPIPLSTLLHHEFSGIGKDFLKRFASLTLQGGIILLGVTIFSVLMKNMDVEAGIAGAWSMLGYALLLLFIVIKSGSFSNKLTGATA